MVEKLLSFFCHKVPVLYGEIACTFNVHQLLHIPEAGRNLGPLWVISMFPFEGANGDLLQKVTAPKQFPSK